MQRHSSGAHADGKASGRPPTAAEKAAEEAWEAEQERKFQEVRARPAARTLGFSRNFTTPFLMQGLARFQDLRVAQQASADAEAAEKAAEEAAFLLSARAQPLATFADSSGLLAAARAAGLDDAALGCEALRLPLAELLLVEKNAARCYGAAIRAFFAHAAARLAAAPPPSRPALLASTLEEVASPARPGSMYSACFLCCGKARTELRISFAICSPPPPAAGMPGRGRAGGLPTCFDIAADGSTIIEDDTIVIE